MFPWMPLCCILTLKFVATVECSFGHFGESTVLITIELCFYFCFRNWWITNEFNLQMNAEIFPSCCCWDLLGNHAQFIIEAWAMLFSSRLVSVCLCVVPETSVRGNVLMLVLFVWQGEGEGGKPEVEALVEEEEEEEKEEKEKMKPWWIEWYLELSWYVLNVVLMCLETSCISLCFV